MPTIHDVAKLSGVHRSTVSRVLSGKGAVSPKARQKVLDAARQINYHANTVARALKSQRKTAIGLLPFWNYSPHLSEAYYQQTLTGIIDEIGRTPYHLLLNNIRGFAREDNPELDFCHETSLAGLILIAPRAKESDLGFLKKIGVPTLLLFCRTEDPEFFWMDLDNRKGAREAVEHLTRLGHRKIGYIGEEIEYSSNARDRYAGYRQALHLAAIEENPLWARFGSLTQDQGEKSARKLLALPREERPTAFFCSTDTTAFGAVKAIRESGLRIPQDLSVVGFDDYERSAHFDPPLTTVRQPFYRIGQQAVELLEAMIEKPSGKPQHIFIEPELKTRKSTAWFKFFSFGVEKPV
jgi:LacI family transcriptional regulator